MNDLIVKGANIREVAKRSAAKFAHLAEKDDWDGKCCAENREGNRCGQIAEPGYVVCHYHGGKTPRGIESVHFQGRGYSQDLPAQLADRMLATLQDIDFSSMRQEIALVDARLGELLQKLDSGETGTAWRAVIGAYSDLEDARGMDEGQERDEKEQAAMGDLWNAITSAGREREAWMEIYDGLEVRRKMADTETKRDKARQESLSMEEAMALIGTIVRILYDEIEDRDLLRRVGEKIRKLMNKKGVRE
jgi:hypothetical protein